MIPKTTSLSRYKIIEGQLKEPIIYDLKEKLEEKSILNFTQYDKDTIVGWSSCFSPYIPEFDNIVFGDFFIFSLRIDKRQISAKLIKKEYEIAIRNLKMAGKSYFSRNEKEEIKEKITEEIRKKIPYNPNVYNLIWFYEEKILYFLTTQINANKILEEFFYEAFEIRLTKLFPYTFCELNTDFSLENIEASSI